MGKHGTVWKTLLATSFLSIPLLATVINPQFHFGGRHGPSHGNSRRLRQQGGVAEISEEGVSKDQGCKHGKKWGHWVTPFLPPCPKLSVALCVSPLFPLQGQRWHLGSEPFGRPWQSGDVVGCMIDLTENTIIFTLNGEVLMSDSGSETAFREIEIGDGESRDTACAIPICLYLT